MDVCPVCSDLPALDPETGPARQVAPDAPDPYAPLRKRPS